MTSVFTIVVSVTAVAAIFALRREMLALGCAMGRGIIEFRAMLKEIDDDLWQR